MKHKIPWTLGDNYLPVAQDEADARERIDELSKLVALLRSDVDQYNEPRDRGRLGRTLVRRAEAYLLCGEADAAVDDLDQTAHLFKKDDRTDALMLIDARLAWAMTLQGDAPTAVATLQEILAQDNITVRAWRDQFLLWLAGAHMALSDHVHAKAALEQAQRLIEAEPKRDGSLIQQALQRLGAD